MILMPEFLKKFNLHIDGVGLAGAIEDLTLPVITIMTDDHRAGGMDSPIEIDMGLEKLQSEFTLSGIVVDVLKKTGVIGGSVPITIRGAYKRDGEEAKAIKANGEVLIKSSDLGTWTPGSKNQTKVNVTWRSYILTVDGEEIYNIDLAGGKRKILGVDQIADETALIGL